jgi:hypothetical protein
MKGSTMTKTCKHCREAKPLERYGKHPKTKDRLHTWCRDCQSERGKAQYAAAVRASEARVVTPWEPEAREQQNGSQTATETRRLALADYENTFADMTEDVRFPDLESPWPFESGYGLTEEQDEAIPGLLIALMRKDAAGSKFLLSQVCESWEDVMSTTSFVIELLVDAIHSNDAEERVIQAAEKMIANAAFKAA